MKYIVMECHPSYAVLLDEEGRFVKAANLHYETGQTVCEPVLMREEPVKQRNRLRWARSGFAAVAACFLLLIGLNYYDIFLRGDGQVPTLDDLYRHAERFLALGAEDCLALGSDFDGADLPPCLDGPEKAARLYGYFLDRGLSPALAEKILWKNALEFFRANLP